MCLSLKARFKTKRSSNPVLRLILALPKVVRVLRSIKYAFSKSNRPAMRAIFYGEIMPDICVRLIGLLSKLAPIASFMMLLRSNSRKPRHLPKFEERTRSVKMRWAPGEFEIRQKSITKRD